MPVSRLNIAVRRPFGSDVTQAPIIPSSQVETVLRNPRIKQAPFGQIPFYFDKNAVSAKILARLNRPQTFPIFPALRFNHNRFNRYFSPNLSVFVKILKKTLKKG